MPSASGVSDLLTGLRRELAWQMFLWPRLGVQWLAAHLPLTTLRDRLPTPLAERLRLGLYPARITPPGQPACLRRHPPWGDPAQLDPTRPVAYTAPPTASILLVTYNSLDLSRLCLASLQRAAGALPFELIVVDNASTDGTPQWLRQLEHSRLLPLRVVLNQRNAGFAAATNQAARLARGPVLVFLNNDTVVPPGWLEGLVEPLLRDPSIGLIGPATNSCGTDAQVGTLYADLEGMFRFAADYTHRHRDQLIEVPMLALFCAATPAELFERVGGLDERYGAGLFEDDDLAEAIRRAGRRVVLHRGVFVHHYGGATFAHLPPRRYLRLFWENRRRFEAKWGIRWQAR
ncbi:MAG: glycosyltransferase family 2 protein [Myxococcota bacterium]|nr:glycosyltransferase family 2 protein [Myxococcota bacterium]